MSRIVKKTRRDVFTVLVGHGLQASEARAYLALLDHPTLTAGPLAELAEIPRSHVYRVLQSLQALGLVDVLIQGTTRSYRARPFRGYLESRLADLRTRTDQVEEDIRDLAEVLEPPPPELPLEGAPGAFRAYYGRRAIAREIDEVVASATSRVVLASSDRGSARIERHCLSALEAWKGRPTRPLVEVLLPHDEKPSPALDARADEGAIRVFRFRVPRPTISVTVDERLWLYVRPIPDTGDLRVGRDFGLSTTDSVFVASEQALLFAAADPL